MRETPMTVISSTEVEHEIVVAAPAEAIYDLIASPESWPRIFPPTIYVERLERSGNSEEHLHIWATANGQVRDWTSRRVLSPDERRIDFRQAVSPAPIAAMGGSWIVEPLDDGRSRLRLSHDFRVIDDVPADLARISEAVDTNSRSELTALKQNLERATEAADLTFSFEEGVHIDGAPQDVYDFINEADQWPERHPHVG